MYIKMIRFDVLGLLEIKEILDQKNIYLNIKLWPIKFSVLSIGVFGKLIACILFCDFNSLKSLHVYIHTFRWKNKWQKQNSIKEDLIDKENVSISSSDSFS